MSSERLKKSQSFVVCMALIAVCLMIQACSSGLNSSVEEQDVNKDKILFKVVAKDGSLVNVLVYFCSVKKGIIAGPFDTDINGVALPSFNKSLLNSLEEDDQVYWWVTSRNSSSVTINRADPRLKALTNGQVSIKSYLGRAVLLQSKAVINPDLSQDTTISKASVVTHFSNARSNLLEVRWKQIGMISGVVNPATPLNSLSEKNLKNMVQTAQELDQRFLDSSSATTHKLKLMAVMTKAVIEHDVSRLLDGTSDAGLSKVSESLFLVAENNFREVSAQFLKVFDEVFAEVELDLLDLDIRASIGNDNVINSLRVISQYQTRLAVASDLIDNTPRLSVNDIVPVPSNSTSFRYPGEIAKGSLNAVPVYATARGTFVFEP